MVNGGAHYEVDLVLNDRAKLPQFRLRDQKMDGVRYQAMPKG
jgi:hypothetical protein